VKNNILPRRGTLLLHPPRPPAPPPARDNICVLCEKNSCRATTFSWETPAAAATALYISPPSLPPYCDMKNADIPSQTWRQIPTHPRPTMRDAHFLLYERASIHSAEGWVERERVERGHKLLSRPLVRQSRNSVGIRLAGVIRCPRTYGLPNVPPERVRPAERCRSCAHVGK